MEPYTVLEKRWADFNDLHYSNVVACSSGTAALHLALEALELPLGSRVAVPDFSMIAVARAVALAGMVPVPIDCGDDLNIDAGVLYKALSNSVASPIRAVVVVHTYGRRCDMETIGTATDANDVLLIEDMAEAHGVMPYEGSDAYCWSFYKNKIVHGEEGGAVGFKSTHHAAQARMLRCLGFTPAHDFKHVPRGHNYRLANSLAELIIKSIESYPANLRARRECEASYNVSCPLEWRTGKRDAPWVYDMRLAGYDEERLLKTLSALVELGYEARRGFYPVHLQAEFKRAGVVVASDRMSSRSLEAYNQTLYIPLAGRPWPKNITAYGRPRNAEANGSEPGTGNDTAIRPPSRKRAPQWPSL